MSRRPDRWVALVIAALAVRYAFAAVLGATQLVAHNGWFWSGNKDQVQYYATANALLHGAVAHVYTFIGYGVLLTPFVAGTQFVLQAIPRVAIVQLLLAAPAAMLLFRAGCRLFDRRSAALGTALWLTVPIWLSPIWFHSYSPAFNMAPFWIGLQISVDYATGLLAIAVLALAAGARSEGGTARGVAIGVLSGAAVLAKPSNAVLVASAVAALWVWRRRRAAAAALVSAALLVSAQLALDWRISGNPLHMQYLDVWPYGSKPQTSLAYVPRSLGKLLLLNYTGPLLTLAFVAALVVTWRRYPAARWLVVAQAVGYVAIFSPLYYSISEFMLRFMTTALPALCLACGAAIGRARRDPALEDARSLGRVSTAAAVLALVAAAGLAILVGVGPLRPVIPVVGSMSPTVTKLRRLGWVVVSWHAPSAPAKLTYRVNRARSLSRPASETSIWVGVRTAIRDRPPRGTWWYRVYVEPGSDPGGLPAGTRYFAVSPATRVDVP